MLYELISENSFSEAVFLFTGKYILTFALLINKTRLKNHVELKCKKKKESMPLFYYARQSSLATKEGAKLWHLSLKKVGRAVDAQQLAEVIAEKSSRLRVTYIM